MEHTWRPRPVTHLFRHYTTGQLVLLEIKKDEKNNVQFWDIDGMSGQDKDFETLTLWTLGKSTKIWEDMMTEAKALFTKETSGKTVVYRYHRSMWKVFGQPKDVRPWKSVITQENIKDTMLTDIKKFKDSEKQYKTLGIPYRRGYLLHGPPGTGKSSLVSALAGKLGTSLCVLTLSDRNMSDDDFMKRLAAVPKNSIVLIEDIDVALPSQKRKRELEVKMRHVEEEGKQYGFSSTLTMSGVLNGIDGVGTVDSQILIMTTNHKNNLDPALLRHGR